MVGINLLPFTPASAYLGADPAYLKSIFALLPAEEQHYREHGVLPPYPPPADIWQDALAEGLALADPDAALARWNPAGSVEAGETRSHTLYAVFRDPSGVRTHLAYNARDQALTVAFSDGTRLAVAPHSLARAH